MSDQIDIPSRMTDLLQSVIGHRILDATRHSWWLPAVAQGRRGIAAQEVFSRTCGPVTFEFDNGLVLGLDCDPRQQSVVVWTESDESAFPRKWEPAVASEQLHPVHSADPVFSNAFWHGLVGTRIAMISIFVRRPAAPKMALLPNEVGLCFLLDSGARFVAAKGLADVSDDFVIVPEAQFLAVPRPGLREVSLADCQRAPRQ